MRTLYVTDLDGTLMKNDMTISAESVRILNQQIERGILITYATSSGSKGRDQGYYMAFRKECLCKLS